jgi:hypothetical protein
MPGRGSSADHRGVSALASLGACGGSAELSRSAGAFACLGAPAHWTPMHRSGGDRGAARTGMGASPGTRVGRFRARQKMRGTGFSKAEFR